MQAHHRPTRVSDTTRSRVRLIQLAAVTTLALCAAAPTAAHAAEVPAPVSDLTTPPVQIPERTLTVLADAGTPAVTAAADATWTFDVPALTVVPAPAPVTPAVAEPTSAPVTPQVPTPAKTKAAQPTASRTPTAATSAAPAAPMVSPGAVSSVATIALRYVGVPYVSGGTTPAGFDCSGFTQFVYAQAGVALPRTADAQRDAGTVIPASQAAPGDLIWTPGHVAIYLGGGQQIDAPRPGKSIAVRAIWQTNPVFLRLG